MERGGIEAERSGAEDIARGGSFAAFQHGLDAQQQFLGGERFGDIIIGTEFESGHTVLGLGAGGEHDDRGVEGARVAAEFLEDTRRRPCRAASGPTGSVPGPSVLARAKPVMPSWARIGVKPSRCRCRAMRSAMSVSSSMIRMRLMVAAGWFPGMVCGARGGCLWRFRETRFPRRCSPRDRRCVPASGR